MKGKLHVSTGQHTVGGVEEPADIEVEPRRETKRHKRRREEKETADGWSIESVHTETLQKQWFSRKYRSNNNQTVNHHFIQSLQGRNQIQLHDHQQLKPPVDGFTGKGN